jgi:hypothetical protein
MAMTVMKRSWLIKLMADDEDMADVYWRSRRQSRGPQCRLAKR